MIQNPVLRGFHPDPSIVRVGSDYYLATSTFEWFPGVRLHHSRDLAHWRLAGHALTRRSQLDLRGIADSRGVWAPSLSHADGQFWLIYTIVRTAHRDRPFVDVGIYLVTAPAITGPWSDPVALNAIGFDPSLFHDQDGRKWLVNLKWDFRKPGTGRFSGIVMQEYDPRRQQLVGPMTNLMTKPTLTEGPNLYRFNGWYYLMTADGGTGWEHGISMARSREIRGPYELDPQEAVLTTRDAPSWPLQKAGHGELVETPSGEWYLAHLASRPLGLGEHRRCILGRETCIQKVRWSDDGWLRLAGGGWRPELAIMPPAGVPAHPWPASSERDDFDAQTLDNAWSALRCPIDESWLSLTERPGWLRLRGRESLHSWFTTSLIARRLTAPRMQAETCLDFHPDHFTQLAGLACFYDTRTHYYLRVTHDEKHGRVLGIVLSDDGVYVELVSSQSAIDAWQRCFLRATIDHAALQFSASADGAAWRQIGPILDASKLSDDYGSGLHFTGASFALCAQDLNGTHTPADFDYFMVRELPQRH